MVKEKGNREDERPRRGPQHDARSNTRRMLSHSYLRPHNDPSSAARTRVRVRCNAMFGGPFTPCLFRRTPPVQLVVAEAPQEACLRSGQGGIEASRQPLGNGV